MDNNSIFSISLRDKKETILHEVYQNSYYNNIFKIFQQEKDL